MRVQIRAHQLERWRPQTRPMMVKAPRATEMSVHRKIPEKGEVEEHARHAAALAMRSQEVASTGVSATLLPCATFVEVWLMLSLFAEHWSSFATRVLHAHAYHLCEAVRSTDADPLQASPGLKAQDRWRRCQSLPLRSNKWRVVASTVATKSCMLERSCFDSDPSSSHVRSSVESRKRREQDHSVGESSPPPQDCGATILRGVI